MVARPLGHGALSDSFVNSQPSAALGVAHTLRVGSVAPMSRYARAAAEAPGGTGLRRVRGGYKDAGSSMLRAPQIFAALDEAWDSFKCGDYEAGVEVCGH